MASTLKVNTIEPYDASEVTINELISNSVNIDGGAIDGTTVGSTTTAAGAFTTLTASSTLQVTGNTTLTGTLAVNTSGITTTQTTFALLNATATTVNFAGGASTALNIGHASGLTTIAGATTITTGSLTIASTILTSGTTANVFNTVATTVNAFGGASTALNLGHASGTTTIAGATTIAAGALTVTGGTVTTGASTSLSLATTGGTQAQAVNVASSVEFVGLYGAASAGIPSVRAVGASAVLALGFSSKSTGALHFYTNGTTNEHVRIPHAAADRYIELTGGVSAAPTLKASSDRLRLPEGIYIGADSTNNLLDDASTGAGTATLYIGNAAITVASDMRLKSDIEDTKRDALGIVNKLRVVDHSWNDPSDTAERNRNSRGKWMSVLAQEVIEYAPWLVNAPDPECAKCKAGKSCNVHTQKWKDKDKQEEAPVYWHMDLAHMGPLLARAIQQIDQRLVAKGI